MTPPPAKKTNKHLFLIALIAVQAFSAVFFIGDVIADFRAWGFGVAAGHIHLYIETAAALSLVAAIVVEVNYLMRLLRRKEHLENSLRLAGSAVHDVIEAEFEDWQLTPAEQDVATFLVKGLSTVEIADMRGSAEGTVKAHLNAIYRKSGTKNRAEMLSLLIDTMMGGPRNAA
jgi:DNA-binding NarL/FixJ family response regulator